MRCIACDNALTDRESVRRVASTGEFLDLCDKCYGYIKEDVLTTEHSDSQLVEENLKEE